MYLINKKIIVVVAVLLIIGYYVYSTLTPSFDKLGELSFYKDANMELKVVLVHENLPFHYVGNSYSIACQTKDTIAPSNDDYEWRSFRIEKGWNMTPQAYLGNGLDNNNSFGNNVDTILKDLSDKAKKVYMVKDKNTVVILANPNVYVSFNGCRTFNNWVMKNNLPKDLIVVESTSESEKCVAQQKKDKELGLTSYGDCSYLKFTGEGLPVFQSVVARDNGYASFKVTSSAFKNNQIVDVQTNDFGKTWQSTINDIPGKSTNKTNNKSINNFGIVSFTNTDVGAWPLEWRMTISPEDIKEARGFGFRIVSQLTNMKPQINEGNLLYDIIVDQKEIQSHAEDPVDIKFRLSNSPNINPSGPRIYQYLDIPAEYYRLNGPKNASTSSQVTPYASSFSVHMLGSKIIDILSRQKGDFVDSRALIATIKTGDDKNSYIYDIFLEKIPTK